MRQSTNPEVVAAWATVPEVAEAQQRHEAARKLLRDFPRRSGPAEALGAVRDAAIATFNESGKWPTSFARDAAKAHGEALVYEAELVALRLLQEQTKNSAEGLRDVLSVDVLTHLDGRLKEILDAAKGAAQTLGGVTTPEQAIDAGGDVLDAWRTLTALLREFRDVRNGQWEVLNAVNLDDQRARIRRWRAEGHGEIRSGLSDVPAPIRDVMCSGAYTIEYLAWLAQNGAAYVPTSYIDLEDEATAGDLVDAFAGAEGPVDYSPVVLPPLTPKPAETYAHSSTPHLDHSQPAPARPKANATAPERERTTRDYF
ncbi:hypothetical protein ACFV19_26210 [Streptomyces griseoluteus]|uniref:hypothetical protein n=1 Tax=Streptomyces griseoluteus TaxID=29306 RepID=UPI00369984C8